MKTYSEFKFAGLEIGEEAGRVRISYAYEIPGLTAFEHLVHLPSQIEETTVDPSHPIFYLLGLFEMLSYWKAVVAENIWLPVILEPYEDWIRNLMQEGLGQFYYENNLDGGQIAANINFTYFDSPHKHTLESVTPTLGPQEPSGSVIMVGGGKDSILAMELLKAQQVDNLAFIVQTNSNSIQPALDTAKVAGFSDDQIVTMQRKLDPQLIELNKQGFFNGHVPISATFGTMAALVGLLFGKKYIVAANESSANESSVKGSDVNHQYSKTFKFEKKLHQILQDFIDPELYYYSILRPLNELQIASRVSKMHPYFPYFVSCNVGGKEGKWCGECSKCLFTFIIFSPFLDQSELVEIFGKNVLEEDLVDDFEKLIGARDAKPFECVGTFEEVNAAISLGIERFGANLPLLYLHYLHKFAHLRPSLTSAQEHIESYFDTDHLIPEKFIEYVTQ